MVDELKDGEFYMDPNGVPMPKRSLHEHQYTVEQLREMKQKYLMENVINCGYDPTEFAQFMEYKMGKYLSLLLSLSPAFSVAIALSLHGLLFKASATCQ